MPISSVAKPSLSPSEEVKSSKEYKELHAYVHSKTESTSHAQDQFCEPVEDSFMKNQDADAVEGLLWNDWKAVTGIAAHTSGQDHQQRLVDFVLGLQSRPVLRKGDVTCKVFDQTVWTDLPVLGAQIREVFNFSPDQASKEEQTQWLHLNTFLALLVETATSKKLTNVDFSLYGIWAIRQALESSETPQEVQIETAAIWLRYAASAIYALSKQNKSFDGKVAAPGPRFEGSDWKGFSVERWRAWSSRLSDLQDQKLGQHCEQLITAARQTMGEYLER